MKKMLESLHDVRSAKAAKPWANYKAQGPKDTYSF
tara:strand:- start:19346 stop:19450 length:105 start_codon:yes stop_codon:yes gene_type:complete